MGPLASEPEVQDGKLELRELARPVWGLAERRGIKMQVQIVAITMLRYVHLFLTYMIL